MVKFTCSAGAGRLPDAARPPKCFRCNAPLLETRERDPFLTGGVSGARISGVGGLYVNLSAGVNYWFRPHLAFRGEFKGYPGGQDLRGFAEFRFRVTFRP